MYIVLEIAHREFWYPRGFEEDLVATIRRGTQNGGRGELGRVTVNFTGDGHATVKLIGQGKTSLPQKFNQKANAVAALQNDFGLIVKEADYWDTLATLDPSFIEDRKLYVPKNWGDIGELEKVYAALRRFSAKSQEKDAVKGAFLLRVRVAKDTSGPVPKDAAASFESKVVGGNDSATPVDLLLIGDDVFAHDDWLSVGGRQDMASYSFVPLLHEVGHAVETKTFRTAFYAKRKLRVTYIEQMKKAKDAYDQSLAEADAKRTAYEQRKPKKRYTTSQEDYYKASRGMQSALLDFFNAVSGKRVDDYANADTNIIEAIRARNEIKLTGRDPAVQHFKAVDHDSYLNAIRDAAQNDREIDAMYDKKEVTDSHGKKTITLRYKSSQRLKNFAAYVNNCKIPNVTKYAGESAKEFYAEAYTLWLNDPEYLKVNANPLFNWFEGKFYLSDKDLTNMGCIPSVP